MYTSLIENHNSHNSPLPICDYVRLFSSPLDKGLYVGCGNGRNAFPLLSGGWNLYACDVSNFNIQRAKSICHNMLVDLRLLAMTKLSLTYQILTLLIGGSFFVEMSVGSDTNHGQYQDFDA